VDISPNTHLAYTELSTRVQNALSGIGITTIGQLSHVSLKNVATAGNIGPKGIQELYDFCIRHALKSESLSHAEITGLQTDQGLTPEELRALIATQPFEQIRISTTLSLSSPFCRRLHSYRIHTLADLTAHSRDELVIDALQVRPSHVMELDAFLATTGVELKALTEQAAWRLYAYHQGPRPPVDAERSLDEWVNVLGDYRNLVDDLQQLKYENLTDVLKDYPSAFSKRHNFNHMQLMQLGKRLQFLGFEVKIPRKSEL
jgi:hypothetical protein